MVGNYLYYGDNLDILRHHIASESIDLIYLDPPFNSNRNYNVLFKEKSGGPHHPKFKPLPTLGNGTESLRPPTRR